MLAATALAERLGEAFIPGLLIVLSCASRWVLLTVFAVALAQRPKVRRTLQKEIASSGVAVMAVVGCRSIPSRSGRPAGVLR